jgi:hypothetical protein
MLNTPGRSHWKPVNNVANIIFNKRSMTDILTKREILYRNFFYSKNLNIILPKYLLVTPTNPLLLEIERNFNLIDPILFSSELTRDIFYSNINFIKFILIKDFLSILNNTLNNSFINTSILNNYLYFYLFNNFTNYSINKNFDLYKDQYRPMRKGIINMVRLHATGAVALPIEIRLHILASSKDVIHS